MDMPARQSFIVQMLGRREDLTNAIALNSTMVNGARLIGPAVGRQYCAIGGLRRKTHAGRGLSSLQSSAE